MAEVIALSPEDNVLIVTRPEGLRGVPKGHKIARRPITKGSPIVKFGHVIGIASREIAEGDHVHVLNVEMPPRDFARSSEHVGASSSREKWNRLPKTFQGYPRSNGKAGIRNYVLVVGSVNCSATVVKAVCRHFQSRDLSKHGLDGVIPVTHSSGCGTSIGGENYQILNRTLAGWIFHPNVVGAVVIGLGCEGTTFKSVVQSQKELKLSSDIPIEHFDIQEVGGTAEAISRGIASVEKVLESLPAFTRTELPVSLLNLALNCGGSDSFSSLTANPALGVVSDILVSNGGTVALAEIPECTGAESLLEERCATPESREKLAEIFKWWNDYAVRNQASLNENLSPGNIAGGITTIIEKTLGAVTKAGVTPVRQVVGYAEPITERGVALMNTPGFDPVSVTGLVAGGCNIVTFTTGRGSVYGCSIAPTIKIATTTELFKKMSGDMDVDAGRVLSNGRLDEVAEELYRFVVDVASGRQTCSEKLGLGWEEFTPWPVGETL